MSTCPYCSSKRTRSYRAITDANAYTKKDGTTKYRSQLGERTAPPSFFNRVVIVPVMFGFLSSFVFKASDVTAISLSVILAGVMFVFYIKGYMRWRKSWYCSACGHSFLVK